MKTPLSQRLHQAEYSLAKDTLYQVGRGALWGLAGLAILAGLWLSPGLTLTFIALGGGLGWFYLGTRT